MKKSTLSAKNKKFWALTKPQQRVAVAKDVIAMINRNFINAKKGTYFQFQTSVAVAPEKLDDLFAHIRRSKQFSCDVCGIGACFVGMVDLGNKITTAEVLGDSGRVDWWDEISDSDMRKYLRKIFSPRQLTLIEVAFEMYHGHRDEMDKLPKYNTKQYDKMCSQEVAAEDFGKSVIGDSSKRLAAIMKNIIKNKGEFKP